MTRVSVAVVVCAYTLDRWDDLTEAVASAARQSPPPEELWLVVDHNDELLRRAQRVLLPQHPSLRVVPNGRSQGLSGARNFAVELVTTDVVVFLDDDAAAEDGWLALLTRPYADEAVLAVGGSATPRWSAGEDRPVTLPARQTAGRGELDWVVGCTYQGQPWSCRPVRNLMGCNMSFRRAVFADAGGFAEHLGRIGNTPLGCEETELCIRVQAANPGGLLLFEPAARVRHHVSSDRLSWRYLRRRCFAEGLSKAAVSAMVGQDQALSTERGYAARVLPAAVLRELAAAVGSRGGDRAHHLLGASAVVVGLGATALGYARGRLGSARAAAPAPRLTLQEPVGATPG
jgi:glycosyltransferase involved in cell wall biosynthesis